jgi:serine/threonine protein kinase
MDLYARFGSVGEMRSAIPLDKPPVVRVKAAPGFATLPVGAVVGASVNQRCEIRQVFDAQPTLNSYLVVDEQNQIFALFEAADSKQFDRERYLIEQCISHPALVTLVSAFSETPYEDEEQPRAYLVTEYPLAPITITSLGTPAEIDALRWGAQLAEGLAFLHDHGLAHGNIQLANLIVCNNLVKLWNFATISQLSPELRDRDIYQLAYTLWHWATPLGQSTPTLSPAATLVFQRAFSRAPKQRYHDAHVFAADLQKAIDALCRPEGVNVVTEEKPSVRLYPSQILRQRYQIRRVLGQSGMGAVYQALDMNLNRVCVVKELFYTSPKFQEKFQDEINLLAGIVHPYLPQVVDAFIEPNGLQYLVTDWLGDETLRDLVERSGPLSESVSVGWVRQVLDALDYLHSRTPPMVHLEVIPDNIQIAAEGHAVLTNFSRAQLLMPRSAYANRGVTPGYSPPEQYASTGVDQRTDIYMLGATFYFIVTGADPPDALERISGTPLAQPRAINAAITARTESVIMRAMELLPQNRFQSAKEMQESISR